MPGTDGQSRGVDAVELSRDTGAELKYHNHFLAEKDRLRPWLGDIMKCPKTGLSENPI
jgi:hypothetical protein